jgi:hypothetical protein
MQVRVATRPIDFRKGTDGLVALVREVLGHDPFSGTVFVFRLASLKLKHIDLAAAMVVQDAREVNTKFSKPSRPGFSRSAMTFVPLSKSGAPICGTRTAVTIEANLSPRLDLTKGTVRCAVIHASS